MAQVRWARWVVLLLVAAVLTNAEAYFVAGSKKASLNSEPSDAHFSRFLRIVDDEERAGVSVSVAEKAKSLLLPIVSKGKLAKWLAKGKPADEVFVRLGLKSAGKKLFQSPRFLTWAKYVDDSAGQSAKTPTMIPTLTAQYGDDVLARMIAAAKESDNTQVKQLASRLEVEQLYAWATKGKSPDDAFALFKASTVGDDLLTTPQFSTLTNYLKIFNSKNTDAKTSVIATLVKSYGDEKVAKILQAAMKVPETATTAQKLDTELVQLWLASGKSTDVVFKLLKLDKAGDTLFSNPLLVTWTKYMNAFNQKQKNPNNRASLAATLAAHYGDDGVAAMLKSGDVRNILTKIKPGENLFENPHFLVWVQFVEDPRRSRMALSLMTSLTTKYGDEALVKMIEAAKKVPTTQAVATKLQTQQFQYWASIGKSPDDVFKLYALNKAGDNLLSSPELATVTNYVKIFNKQNPTEQTTLIAAMSKSYGDDVVVTMLEAAKKSRGTSRTAKMLEAEQLQRWMRMEPDDVFKALKLDTTAEKMFNSAQLNAWGKYAGEFNAANPDKKTSLIATMTKSYGDEGVVDLLAAAKKIPGSEAIATRLQSEQLQRWLSNDKAPNEIFTLFKLDKAGDKLLDSPYISSWIQYADDFFNKNVKQKSTTIATMRYYYEDDALAKIILAAEKNPSTRKVGQRVEEELYKGWAQNLYNPDDVFKTLKLDNVGVNLLESPLFGYYTKYMEHFNKGNRGKEATMISALTQNYDDEALTAILVAAKKVPSTEKLATKLQADQIQHWLTQKEKPDELFTVLKLDDSVDDLLTNPYLNSWADYLLQYNKQYNRRESMIDIFRASFGDKDLIKMLIAAKDVPSTKKIATDLQTALLSEWVFNRAPPAAVSKVLTAGGVDTTTKAKLLETYSAKFKEVHG